MGSEPKVKLQCLTFGSDLSRTFGPNRASVRHEQCASLVSARARVAVNSYTLVSQSAYAKLNDTRDGGSESANDRRRRATGAAD
jgi:hypothetical protein